MTTPIDPTAESDTWECACGADVTVTEQDDTTTIVHYGPHDNAEPMSFTKRGPLISIPITDEMRELFPNAFGTPEPRLCTPFLHQWGGSSTKCQCGFCDTSPMIYLEGRHDEPR